MYSLKVLKIACVLVRAAQNTGLVEWLDLVVKVGSVYPTTASTQQSTVLHLCARHSPPFQTDKEVLVNVPYYASLCFFIYPCFVLFLWRTEFLIERKLTTKGCLSLGTVWSTREQVDLGELHPLGETSDGR